MTIKDNRKCTVQDQELYNKTGVDSTQTTTEPVAMSYTNIRNESVALQWSSREPVPTTPRRKLCSLGLVLYAGCGPPLQKNYKKYINTKVM